MNPGFRKRDSSLTCEDSDVCLTVAGDFLCADPTTLDFVDSNGGKGNLDSDTYTMGNGDVTSMASSATALPTPTGSESGPGSGSELKSSSTAVQAKATTTGGSSGSGNAEQSLTSAAGRFEVEYVFGIALAVLGAVGTSL